MAPNQEEDNKEAVKPSNKTAETGNSVDEKSKQTPEPEQVDYKVKFTESQKEALRFREENRKLQEEKAQWQDVASVINEDPELMATIQTKYDQKYNPSAQQPSNVIADKVVDAKVQEKIKPIQEDVQQLRRETVQQVSKTFGELHPDAAEGTDRWQKMLNYLPAMSAAQIPLPEGLERARQMVILDEAKSSGKTEILRDVFTKTQAAAGGGTSGGSGGQAVEAELTPAEKRVAANLNMSPKDYAKWKYNK
jgi:hypothetical protein